MTEFLADVNALKNHDNCSYCLYSIIFSHKYTKSMGLIIATQSAGNTQTLKAILPSKLASMLMVFSNKYQMQHVPIFFSKVETFS